MTAPADTAPATGPAAVSVRGDLVVAAVCVIVGVIVIPYGASMPYIREGIPGPGLFPMMVGGLLILFGILLAITRLLAARRERLHQGELAAATASATAANDSGTAAGDSVAEAAAVQEAKGEAGMGVPVAEGDEEDLSQLETAAVMDTDIGSDGPRRWINGAILMGGIVFFVLFAEILGFPVTMTVLVTAIVWSLRARWWVALITGVLTAVGLWAMFEQGLLVQLPDGIIPGF
ncbi:MAG TPA: tripartite tricarboxylate transporter TctB family protein [Candidatus Brachybacterium merdigallinarum]|nr:tripartite tricarboxylate transporter TctB family protein [Candidatus Brachybacterium merdigallinarum]